MNNRWSRTLKGLVPWLLPWISSPVSDKNVCEKSLHSILSELPLTQLRYISSCLIRDHQRKKKKKSELSPPLSTLRKLQPMMKSSLSLAFFITIKTRDHSCLPSRQWHYPFDDFVSFSVLLCEWTSCFYPFRNVERRNTLIIEIFLW